MLRYTLGPIIKRSLPGAPGFYVRIHDDLRRCVVFLGYADGPANEGFSALGTGFLLDYKRVGYLVTVKHVAQHLEGIPFRARFNRAGGGEGIAVDADALNWAYHPDPNVDAAAVVFHLGGNPEFDNVYVPHGMCADAERMEAEFIGTGDICYTVGLFRLLVGRARNLPVVHVGNIAMLPGDELIPVRDWGNPDLVRHVNGYLVEAQTLSGLSGSPVFVRPTIDHVDSFIGPQGRKISTRLPRHDLWLIGMWQAAWDAPPTEALAAGRGGNIQVPVGMGIVVPIERVIEILEMPDVKQNREEIIRDRDHSSAASPASVPLARVAPTSDKNPNHREDFTRLVGAASKSKPKGGRT